MRRELGNVWWKQCVWRECECERERERERGGIETSEARRDGVGRLGDGGTQEVEEWVGRARRCK